MEPLLLWGLGLLAAAFLILVVELFVPSAGVLTLTSAVVAVAGVVCLWRHDAIWGLTGTLVVVVGGPVAFFIGLQIMPNTPIGRRLVLGSHHEDDEAAPAADVSVLNALVDTEGVVVTDLRPVGTVRIGGQRHAALSEMGLVRSGTKVRVVGVEGTELRVRPLA